MQAVGTTDSNNFIRYRDRTTRDNRDPFGLG